MLAPHASKVGLTSLDAEDGRSICKCNLLNLLHPSIELFDSLIRTLAVSANERRTSSASTIWVARICWSSTAAPWARLIAVLVLGRIPFYVPSAEIVPRSLRQSARNGLRRTRSSRDAAGAEPPRRYRLRALGQAPTVRPTVK